MSRTDEHVSTTADCLPDRRNRRDPLSSRRTEPDCRNSGYVVRPPRARREKPRVSAFISADIAKILDLKPDLVLTFSDLQADIAATLIRHGVDVHAFNQRTIPQILDMIRTLGALVGVSDRANRLADELAGTVADARARAFERPCRPKVYFEEWDDPMISGIGWVSELIEAAGGIDIFADRAQYKSAKDRIVTAEEVIRHAPDIIIGSWCGKKFRPEKVAKRPGFDRLPAVQCGKGHFDAPLTDSRSPTPPCRAAALLLRDVGPPLPNRSDLTTTLWSTALRQPCRHLRHTPAGSRDPPVLAERQSSLTTTRSPTPCVRNRICRGCRARSILRGTAGRYARSALLNHCVKRSLHHS